MQIRSRRARGAVAHISRKEGADEGVIEARTVVLEIQWFETQRD